MRRGVVVLTDLRFGEEVRIPLLSTSARIFTTDYRKLIDGPNLKHYRSAVQPPQRNTNFLVPSLRECHCLYINR